MSLFPVISRELRAASRHAFTYYLRTIGAGAALLALIFYGFGHGFERNMGSALFAGLHLTLFLTIWFVVPILTSDCISRERREGTLGLLFLTGLRAGTIVMAKGCANGVRAFTLWLAVLPVITLPLLLGGVTWSHAVLCGLVDFNALCWALAAGLLGSALSKVRHRALVIAICLSFVFMFALAIGTGLMLWGNLWRASSGSWGISEYIFFAAVQLGLLPDFTMGWFPGMITGRSTARLLVSVCEGTGFSLLFLALSVLIAGARTRRVWQEQPPSARQIWFRNTFCSPIVFQGFYRRWLRRKLLRNPVGWLEQRTWTGRLVTWGWFGVVISLYTAVFSDRNFLRGYSGLQHTIAWLLAGSMAMTAAGSFRRERETGVLELLLVSPIGERELIWGRLRGLWGQFLPAIALLLGIWLYFSSLLPDDSRSANFWFCASTFATVPVVGLYYSLNSRGFMSAVLATLVMGVFAPIVLASLSGLLLWAMANGGRTPYYSTPAGYFGRAVLAQVCIAVWSHGRLVLRLRHRSFPLETGEKSGN